MAPPLSEAPNFNSLLRIPNVFDFALLEELFLDRLGNGTLQNWLDAVQVLLIDEYQDTNPLQEAIYFAIIAAAHPQVTLVGDDDQAMYRFRGGSVELFTGFADRCNQATGTQTRRGDMVRNFRSTPEIVQFYNDHIVGDPAFTPARILPPKPLVMANRSSQGIPVLGMFRARPSNLAADLASLLGGLITNRRVTILANGHSIEIAMSDSGDLGDAVLLGHSIEEAKYDRFNSAAEIRFPGMFRQEMQMNGLQVFNPRGRALRTIADVSILLGLILLSLDPDSTMVNEVFPTNEARFFLAEWRRAAASFVTSNPEPRDNHGLAGFLLNWQSAAAGNISREFPRDWPALELIFKLITWMPGFQDDPEHQVWLEAITRIISGAGVASPYGMQLLQNTARVTQGEHVRRSRLSLIRDGLLPVAEDELEVDEDIMPSVPRNWLQLMTIHQSKGLEFPLVIVDVSSHFTRNHPAQRFRRFPERISNVVQAENDVEPYLPTSLRGARSGMDRTFDDLVRLYYVAYSRPQSVLLLVGSEASLNHTRSSIPNVALGWNRDESWPWRQNFVGRRPPVIVNTPMLLI